MRVRCSSPRCRLAAPGAIVSSLLIAAVAGSTISDPTVPPDLDGVSWFQTFVRTEATSASFQTGPALAPNTEAMSAKEAPLPYQEWATSVESTLKQAGLVLEDVSVRLNLLLGAGVVALALALRLVLQLLWAAKQDREPACQVLLSEIPVEPVEQPLHTGPAPLPLRRLPRVEASFVLPLARILRRPATKVLRFDIPTHPGLKPYRATLSPSATGDRWAQIELTVDVLTMFGLPPLLSCEPASVPARLQCSGSTGGTGTLAGEDAATGVAAGGDGKNPWLQICNASGAIVASITPQQDGHCILQRQDHPLWNINMDVQRWGEEGGGAEDAEEVPPLITVSRVGQDIGQATALRLSEGSYLQVDSQYQAQCPETPMLLMSVLAALAFRT
jgi:hypothetical protein